MASQWDHSVCLLYLLNIRCDAFASHPWCGQSSKLPFFGVGHRAELECYPACTGFWIQSPAWKMRKRKLNLQLDRSSCSAPVMLCLFLLSVGMVLLVPLVVVRNVVNISEYTPRSTAGCDNSMCGLFLRDCYYCFHDNLQFITFPKAMHKHFCCSTFLLTPIFNFHLFCVCF